MPRKRRTLNKEMILFDLKEALEELQSTIENLETDPEYSVEELEVAMMHMYHHLNTAWNGRFASWEEAGEKFYEFRDFPKDIYMGDPSQDPED